MFQAYMYRSQCKAICILILSLKMEKSWKVPLSSTVDPVSRLKFEPGTICQDPVSISFKMLCMFHYTEMFLHSVSLLSRYSNHNICIKAY